MPPSKFRFALTTAVVPTHIGFVFLLVAVLAGTIWALIEPCFFYYFVFINLFVHTFLRQSTDEKLATSRVVPRFKSGVSQKISVANRPSWFNELVNICHDKINQNEICFERETAIDGFRCNFQ